MAAALHHGLHLRLDLADVEARRRELLLEPPGDLHRLGRGETAPGVVDVEMERGERGERGEEEERGCPSLLPLQSLL